MKSRIGRTSLHSLTRGCGNGSLSWSKGSSTTRAQAVGTDWVELNLKGRENWPCPLAMSCQFAAQPLSLQSCTPMVLLLQKLLSSLMGGGGERKGCNNNPKPFHLSSLHIYQQAQFSAALSLSLAHDQMITQGFAERKHEATEPASPLPVWGVGGSGGHHIIRRKRCTCFQRWRGVERAHKESQVVARKITI